MLGIDEGTNAALLLCLGDAMQRERGLARRFRAVNLDHPAARQPADAERYVEAERAGGHRLDVHRLHVFAEPHDRALAEAALDLGERGIESFRFVHGRSFDETKRCTHVRCSLWPGFDGLTTDAPNGSPGVLSMCPSCRYLKQRTLFFVVSKSVLFRLGGICSAGSYSPSSSNGATFP